MPLTNIKLQTSLYFGSIHTTLSLKCFGLDSNIWSDIPKHLFKDVSQLVLRVKVQELKKNDVLCALEFTT